MLIHAAMQHDRSMPSTFNLQMVPIFVSLLAVQALLTIARFLVADASGAITMLLLIIVGTLALAPRGTSIHPGYAGCMGAVCFLQGLFDIALLIERETRPEMYSKIAHPHLENRPDKYGLIHTLRTVVLIFCP